MSEIPRIVTIHEAAHAVAALVIDLSLHNDDSAAFDIITVGTPDGDALLSGVDNSDDQCRGCVIRSPLWVPTGEFARINRDHSLGASWFRTLAGAEAAVNLAGPIAQAKVSHVSLTTVHLTSGRNDFCHACACLKDASETKQQFYALYQHIEEKTKQLVRDFWRQIEALADELQIHHRLEIEEALAIIKDA
jgi:hypothetical protein